MESNKIHEVKLIVKGIHEYLFQIGSTYYLFAPWWTEERVVNYGQR